VCKLGLTLFENRVLRKIFGTKTDEVTGGWEKMHSELNNLYRSLSLMTKSKRGRYSGHVKRMEEKKNAYRMLAGKPEVKSQLGT
jgi:hypothetical protein